MKNEKDLQFETKVVHSSYNSNKHGECLTPPIYQTSTFTFPSMEQGAKRFSQEQGGYVYSRLENPTVAILEDRIAQLEEAEAGLAFSSGMAAVSAALMEVTKTNDHILCSKGVYGCTFGLLQWLKDKHNIQSTFADLGSEEEIKRNIQTNTTCVYIETPINPTMQVIDIPLVTSIAKEKGIKVIVDNTFSTPYLQKPLKLGCDLVVHSATKYIGGHGDVIAGVMAGNADMIDNIKKTVRKDFGGVLSPFDAWLLIRGVKTLAVRMDRHCENAEKIAAQLKKHPNVKAVYYPGDKEHAQSSLVKKQMRRGGGVLSFELNGSYEDAVHVVNQLQLIPIAVSLGDAETLIQHPASMTHAVIPPEQRVKMGITNELLRLSVGLEAWEDIWQDLEQALNTLSS